MRRLLSQFARFGVVGAGGVVIDFVVFNVLRATVLDPSDVAHGPLVAKVISTTVAIVFNWLGNRYWTFRHDKRDHWLREAVEFAIVSLGGMGIALGCLGVSHYLLGFTDVVSDNIATNVVGLALGTAFRFTFYRLWVFRGERAPAVELLGIDLPADDIGTTATATPSARSHRAPGPASADGAPQRG
ncbi:GtrA family protein [Galbitalea sp. SE-J8]|uniref:GtrA family protein n=1 Tax=Galbitalea sp. SE-J8 TaxID=3054952 RepID=UPI00259CA2FE|nr:GtrA family protein [Galbitalea sp. SE-J8]MDM4762733.1 GtrA family protein [Galbitalea sp. SE-J8]